MNDKPDPELTTYGEVENAERFVVLLRQGESLRDAADATGLSEHNALVRQRLKELGVFAKVTKETFRPVSESRLMKVIVLGEDRDAIAAHGKLYPELDGPATVEIHLSPEIAKLDVTLPGFPSAAPVTKEKKK